ncbi:hypothetical protein BpHYR1_010530 [Brachionus plicatilis]|uniref:Uncharacterized protein n=1 Tax=Brachionus plicatilis TaxID=10195 RepID=A0A3M7PPE7_BRAPC|nr:hypothetical protein BpHYR1_010530 [Brachionus plicatilis]
MTGNFRQIFGLLFDFSIPKASTAQDNFKFKKTICVESNLKKNQQSNNDDILPSSLNKSERKF